MRGQDNQGLYHWQSHGAGCLPWRKNLSVVCPQSITLNGGRADQRQDDYLAQLRTLESAVQGYFLLSRKNNIKILVGQKGNLQC